MTTTLSLCRLLELKLKQNYNPYKSLRAIEKLFSMPYFVDRDLKKKKKKTAIAI